VNGSRHSPRRQSTPVARSHASGPWLQTHRHQHHERFIVGFRLRDPDRPPNHQHGFAQGTIPSDTHGVQPPLPPPPAGSTRVPPTTKRGTNTKAIWSLVLGILGFYPVPLIGSIAALILGYRALRETRTFGQGGRRLAVAGVVLGWVVVALMVALLAWASVVCAREHCG
jgi:hypothetical protein